MAGAYDSIEKDASGRKEKVEPAGWEELLFHSPLGTGEWLAGGSLGYEWRTQQCLGKGLESNSHSRYGKDILQVSKHA